MKSFVLDATVALGWLVDDPPSAYAGHIQKLMIDGAQPGGAGSLAPGDRESSAHRWTEECLRGEMTEILSDVAALQPFVETDHLPDEIGALVV